MNVDFYSSGEKISETFSNENRSILFMYKKF